MKKIYFILLLLIFLVGCTNSETRKIEKLINEIGDTTNITKLDTNKVNEVEELTKDMSKEDLEKIKNLEKYETAKKLIDENERLEEFNKIISLIDNYDDSIIRKEDKNKINELMGKLKDSYQNLNGDSQLEVSENYINSSKKVTSIIVNIEKQEKKEQEEKKEQLAREKAEYENKLKSQLSKLKLIGDNFSETNTYYANTVPSDNQYWFINVRSLLLPFIIQNGDDYNLGVIVNYFGYDWLFIENVIIKVDGEFYDPYNVVEANFNREVCDGGYVSESDSKIIATLNNEAILNQYYGILLKICESDEAIVRFKGDKGTEDLTISKKDKIAIRQVLDAWETIVKIKNISEL